MFFITRIVLLLFFWHPNPDFSAMKAAVCVLILVAFDHQTLFYDPLTLHKGQGDPRFVWFRLRTSQNADSQSSGGGLDAQQLKKQMPDLFFRCL